MAEIPEISIGSTREIIRKHVECSRIWTDECHDCRSMNTKTVFCKRQMCFRIVSKIKEMHFWISIIAVDETTWVTIGYQVIFTRSGPQKINVDERSDTDFQTTEWNMSCTCCPTNRTEVFPTRYFQNSYRDMKSVETCWTIMWENRLLCVIFNKTIFSVFFYLWSLIDSRNIFYHFFF